MSVHLADGIKKDPEPKLRVFAGRGDWIRTSDPHTPSMVRYQTALRPGLLRRQKEKSPHIPKRGQ